MMRFAALLFLSAIALPNAFAQSPAQVERPEFVIGDRWVSRQVDLHSDEEVNKWELKVTGLHEDSVQFAGVTLANKDASKVGKSYKTSASRSTLTIPNSLVVEGKEVKFDFPLEVGKTWKYDYKNARSDGKGYIAHSAEAKVDGWEDVEVPAGKFKALKVTHYIFYSNVNASGRTTNRATQKNYWYSPEVKREVKYEFVDRSGAGDRVRTELVEYEVK